METGQLVILPVSAWTSWTSHSLTLGCRCNLMLSLWYKGRGVWGERVENENLTLHYSPMILCLIIWDTCAIDIAGTSDVIQHNGQFKGVHFFHARITKCSIQFCFIFSPALPAFTPFLKTSWNKHKYKLTSKVFFGRYLVIKVNFLYQSYVRLIM